ncbi:phosphotransferase enzyme family protein [Cognaticolwellia mytili]|uniref:phosphotransferase enzyme family protein n=1 Tax=Cognaticolwellia mytili TaxID=1888913 RepID=UPI000A177253|nr:aminoglycoside phosphotransferase family protein [Cognaticolwellia mytili]
MPPSQKNISLPLVLSKFGYTAEKCQITPLGYGLINNTYLVQLDNKRVVLQCLNQNVFNQPQQVTDNADLISEHLKAKYLAQEYALQPIWQHQSTVHKNHVEISGEYWRCLHYIENCRTLEAIQNTAQAHDVANSFAQFTAALADFDCHRLADIIPDFHNLSARLLQLENAVNESSSKLIAQAQSTINYIAEQHFFCQEISILIKQLPLRVTHNDTKINNLLFHNKTNKPIAVIDLDTCMSGYLMHDFGDMVRSCCSSISEDSAELSDMSINFDILAALTNAYVAGFNGSLSEIERKSLLFGVKLMPLMLGIRFLTDFLNGDKYFKTSYATHNLVRAKNQLHMYKLLCQQDSLLTEIVLPTPVLNAIA